MDKSDTSWASQNQIEIGERTGGGQFEELDVEILTQCFNDHSGGDHWLYIFFKIKIKKLERLEVYTNTGRRHNSV